MQAIKTIIKVLSTAIMVIYPFLIYFGLQHLSLSFLALFIVGIAILRLLSFQSSMKEWLPVMLLTTAITVALGVATIIFQSFNWMLFYPVAVNLIMLSVFGGSLVKGMPIIERLARLKMPNLPDSGVRYTRTVTKVWCIFFIVNATIAAITTELSIGTWTLYNGLISYILMGLLFATEWIVRQKQMTTHDS